MHSHSSQQSHLSSGLGTIPLAAGPYPIPCSIPEEFLVAPVADECESMAAGCSLSWQLLSVSLHRAANLGFGIAISGGRDNPHFTSGDPAIVVSDVVNNGPAYGLLQVNDRILSANGVSFENIEYAAAVEIIKSSQQINMASRF
ncbi:hypothetical protein WR25_07193 [Diploscapter pachys]|uniref:PDZ domain-containing protein n=1 Tax=Diploscapter pachys TaxID=2018661 RepID=A0A2A2KFP5_9BILA|nr:hypothetical protein WR25_07193 [Diploscapter pachys]